jgi:hypothetical protein
VNPYSFALLFVIPGLTYRSQLQCVLPVSMLIVRDPKGRSNCKTCKYLALWYISRTLNNFREQRQIKKYYQTDAWREYHKRYNAAYTRRPYVRAKRLEYDKQRRAAMTDSEREAIRVNQRERRAAKKTEDDSEV